MDSKIVALGFLTIFAALIAVYASVVPGSFLLADDRNLTQIPQLQKPVTLNSLKTIFTPGTHIDYYPVRDLDYLIDISFSRSPISFRFHQMILFFCMLIIFYFILRRLGIRPTVSFLLTAFWGLNPFHAEMLCWISARKDLLGLLFAGISVLLFMKDFAFASLLFFTLSVLSKASFSVLPFVALTWMALERVKKKRIWIPVILGCFMALGSSFFQSWFYSVVNDMRVYAPLGLRIEASGAALGRGFAGWFFSRYNALDLDTIFSWLPLNKNFFLLGLSLWCAGIALFVKAVRQKNTALLVMMLAAGAAYAPISGLAYPHRYFYSVRYFEPLFAVLTIGFGYLVLRKYQTSKIATGCLLVLSGFFFWETRNAAQVWETPVGVYRSALEQSPASVALKVSLLYELLATCHSGHVQDCEKREVDALTSELDQLCEPKNGHVISESGDPCYKFYIFKWSEFSRGHKDSEASQEFLQLKLSMVSLKPPLKILSRIELYERIKNPVDPNVLVSFKGENTWLLDPEYRALTWAADCLLSPPTAKEFLDQLDVKRLINPKEIFSYFSFPVGEETLEKLRLCRH